MFEFRNQMLNLRANNILIKWYFCSQGCFNDVHTENILVWFKK